TSCSSRHPHSQDSTSSPFTPLRRPRGGRRCAPRRDRHVAESAPSPPPTALQTPWPESWPIASLLVSRQRSPLNHPTRKGGTTVTTSQMATDKPDEFCAGGESPPTALSPELTQDLAQILADALHEDMKQYPALSDIPPVKEPILCPRPRRRRARQTRVMTLHE